MPAPVDRNRLGDEPSPHLQAHSDDQIHWQPWDETAFEAARERDVPVFLSVGFFGCYWCHVQIRDWFDDDAVTALLNEEFVPVMVDCQERPDIDSIYQTACQQENGDSGWPLAAWLTPGGKPFRIETAVSNSSGGSELRSILQRIGEAWADASERETLEQRAENWTAAVRETLHSVPNTTSTPTEDTLPAAAKALVRSADREYGGWGTGPKFPYSARVLLLLRAYHRTDRDVYREIAIDALDAMSSGGLYDHLGGGFHRYTTDRAWAMPQFEKLLGINAELGNLYLVASQVTDENHFETVARETLEFVNRELSSDDGGFFSALGAGTEDESGCFQEGAFYCWTPTEVQDAIGERGGGGLFTTDGLDERDADLFCDYYGVAENGIFGESSVLTQNESVESLADRYDMTVTQVTRALDTACEEITTTRENRPQPPRDEQILASWNGLAVSAFARAGLALDEKYVEPAIDALDFIHNQLWDDTTETLYRQYNDGVRNVPGLLDDYAAVGRGAFDCYQATGEIEYLAFALELARGIRRDFWDETNGVLYFTPSGQELLLTRPLDVIDSTLPSSTALAVELLNTLELFPTHEDFATIVTEVVDTYGYSIWSKPVQHASLTLTADTAIHYDMLGQSVIDRDPVTAWSEQSTPYGLEPQLLVWQPADESELEQWLEELELADRPAIWEET